MIKYNYHNGIQYYNGIILPLPFITIFMYKSQVGLREYTPFLGFEK